MGMKPDGKQCGSGSIHPTGGGWNIGLPTGRIVLSLLTLIVLLMPMITGSIHSLEIEGRASADNGKSMSGELPIISAGDHGPRDCDGTVDLPNGVPGADDGIPAPDGGYNAYSGKYASSRSGQNIEYRGMWCDGYKIVNRSQIMKLLDFLVQNHFNAISPLINADSDGVFYNSNLYKKHFDVRPNFDPLMTLCTEAHKRGIEVHPWTHVLYNRLARKDNPDWAQISDSGKRSSSWINPALPEVRDHVKKMVMEIARYPVDGIRMDTVRYASGSYSYDDYSNQAYADSGYSSRSQWQRDQVTEVVRMVRNAINEYKPYLWLSADVSLWYSSWYSWVFQESRGWTEEGLVDYLAVMGYTTSESSFRSGVDDWVDHRDGNLLYAGPYAYVPGNSAHGSVSTEEEGIEKLLNQIAIARQEGADGINIFKYDFLRRHPAYGEALRFGPYASLARTPVKEQVYPVKAKQWEFNNQSLREGWELNPRSNYHPLNGVWEINNLNTGHEMTSPLTNIDPDDVTTLEFRARNVGVRPIEVTFEWMKGKEMELDPTAEEVSFIIPDDGEFHILSKRLDDVKGWRNVPDRGNVTPGNISRMRLRVAYSPAGSALTLDYFRLLDIPRCQKEWLLLGPFENVDYEHAIGLDQGGLGEGRTKPGEDILERIPEPGDVTAGHEWGHFNSSRDYIDLNDQGFGLRSNVMYAMNCILAERPMNVTLLLGANDGLDVWLNGELLLSENRTTEMARPDEFSIPLRLREGDNTLAIKLSQEMGEFGFFGRLTDDVGMVPTGAEFVPVLPGVPVPVISNEEPGWGNDPSPLVHFEPAVAPDPRPFFEIVRHWWTVDSASPSPLEPGELNVADGMGELRMPLLEDGKHVFRIRAEDALGRNGGWAEYTFCTDSSIPQYSPPVPERELITAGERETGSVMARWSWNLTSPTLSGINRTEVLVGTSPGKGDLYAEAVTGHITSYEYANLTSVNGTIFLTVTPVSESRMRGPSVSSTGPIVIDVIGPEKVSNLSVIPRLGENDTRVECYEIAWKPSSDDENGSGIALYVVEYRSQNIPEWRRLGVTSPGINNITFHRPPRSERLRFRIHALDNAGNPGPRSDELEIPNLHPVANITFPGERPTNRTLGVPMRVISNSSFDPDGRITAYFWNFGDGTFSYFPEAYHTYTLPGLYNLSLTVYDDFGNHNRTVIALNLTETDEMDGNGTGGSPGGGVPDAEDQPVKDAPEDVSLGEALNDSPLGYIMLATILAFLALFGYVVGSNILSKRQERLSYSLIGKEKGGNSRGAVEGESTWNDIPVNGTGRSGNGMAHQSVRQTGRGPGRQY